MKAIVCEMCGSHELVKRDGLFVCEVCGTKYTLEEAKKLMIDGVVSVAIDTTKKEQDLLKIIETAYEAGNNSELYNMASKLVEMNPNLWQGWYYKGIGACYLSEHDLDRFNEGMTYFDKAIEICSDDDSDRLGELMGEDLITMVKYLFTSFCLKFQTNIDDDSQDNMSEFLDVSFTMLDTLQEDDYYSYCEIYELKNKLVHQFYDTLQKAKDFSDAKFGNNRAQKTDSKYDVWYDEQINISLCIEQLIQSDIRPQDFEPMLRFYTRVMTDRMHSCSYDFYDGDYHRSSYISESGKRDIRKRIKDIVDKKHEILSKANERETKYHVNRNEKYWAEHESEKNALLDRKQKYSDEITPINKKIKEIDNTINEQKALLKTTLPEELVVQKTQRDIDVVKLKLKGFSLFDLKGRKPYKEQLNVLKEQLKQNNAAANSARLRYNSSINKKILDFNRSKDELLRERKAFDLKIADINNELTKNR